MCYRIGILQKLALTSKIFVNTSLLTAHRIGATSHSLAYKAVFWVFRGSDSSSVTDEAAAAGG